MYKLLNSRTLFQFIPVIIFAVAMSSCGSTRPVVNSNNELVDKDGNKYSIKLFQDNNYWMTTNLGSDIPGSFCYLDTARYCEQYGRLYTWEAAQQGCTLLGEGWRLPAKDEWEQLAKLYGEAAEPAETGRRSYLSLLLNGNAEFNALLGGGRDPDGKYARFDAHGFYWTITPNNSSTAWFANFAKGRQSLFVQPEGEIVRGFSVRCVKSMQTPKQ